MEIIHILTGLSNRADAEFIKKVLDSGVIIPFMMSFLNLNNEHYWNIPQWADHVHQQALEFFGNAISQESPEIMTILTERNFVPALAAFLNHSSHHTVKQACWIYSNLCASSSAY